MIQEALSAYTLDQTLGAGLHVSVTIKGFNQLAIVRKIMERKGQKSLGLTATDNATPSAGAVDGALFLPLVMQTGRQEQAFSLSEPTATPILSVPVPAEAPTALPMQTALPREQQVVPLPTPIPVQNQQAHQQLQTLLDQVQQLIASGVLSAVQGQPLIEPITQIMHLPIVIEGQAPPNPTPGQPRPWQRKMQLFRDQVDQWLDSGVLSANQGQPLLDQAQTISQTLGAQ